ncbi:MAG: hypothetical protein RL662_2339 [Bacteroidota bacterium]|jgi:1-acyl-sn-glycerol-3-phosphate acyltransferase
MIEAKRTWLGVVFFELYAKIQLRRYFRNIYFDGSFADRGKPVLIIANHFSWWDGFIQILLNQKVLNKKFHVMMLEEELKKNLILNSTGAFSIKKNSRTVIDSLNYSVQLLKNSCNMVLIFPQGKIESVYTHNFVFEKGIDYILKRLSDDVQVVFNVNLIDYFSFKQPSLSINYKEYKVNHKEDILSIEAAFNDYIHACMNKQVPR